jgi:hypothetical protein
MYFLFGYLRERFEAFFLLPRLALLLVLRLALLFFLAGIVFFLFFWLILDDYQGICQGS